MPSEKAKELKTLIDETSGDYISKSKPIKTEQQGFEFYTYVCEYNKETVTFTLSFKPNSKKVEGIWFGSENLRKKGE